MRDSAHNLRVSELRLRVDLNLLEKQWVIGRLVSKTGVYEVLYRPNDSRNLVVEYDADVVNTDDLLDFLDLCGLPADLIRLPRLWE